MNSPIYIFNNILPQVLIDKIQGYIPVDIVIKTAIKKYYNKLYQEKLLNEEKIFNDNVYPKCVCPNCPDNGKQKLFRRRECHYCLEYEFYTQTNEYTSDKYRIVILDNPQYNYIEYDYIEDDYDSIDEFVYDDNKIWLE